MQCRQKKEERNEGRGEYGIGNKEGRDKRHLEKFFCKSYLYINRTKGGTSRKRYKSR